MPWRGLEWRFGFQVNFTKRHRGDSYAIARADRHPTLVQGISRRATNSFPPPATSPATQPASQPLLARPPPTASQPASRPSPDHHRPRPPRPRPLSTQPKPAKPNPSQPTAGTGPKTNRQPPRPAALFGFAGYALQGLGDVDEEVAHLFEGVEDV